TRAPGIHAERRRGLHERPVHRRAREDGASRFQVSRRSQRRALHAGLGGVGETRRQRLDRLPSDGAHDARVRASRRGPDGPQRDRVDPGGHAMTRTVLATVAVAALGLVPAGAQENGRSMADVRLMTLDPGHFHAALVQKEMYPGVAPRVDVYAPLGPDLVEHLNRIAAYNRRPDRPTAWDLEVHTSADYFERMLRDHPGNVVVLSGRNRGKIDRVLASIRAGLHVLADKPWILKSEDLPKVDAALADADAKGVVAYDIMTERFETTTALQRAFVNDPATFGDVVPGTEAE